MPYEDVRASFEAFKDEIAAEQSAWDRLLEAAQALGTRAQSMVDKALDAQSDNLQQARTLAVSLGELKDLAAQRGRVTAALTGSLQAWVADFNKHATQLETNLEDTLIPALKFSADEAFGHVESFAESMSARAETAADALSDTFSDAGDTIVENLTEAASVLGTAFDELVEKVTEALSEAQSSVQEAWEEARSGNESNREAIDETGETVAQALADAVEKSVEAATGKLGTVTEDVERAIETLETTLANLKTTLETVQTLVEGVSFGMQGTATTLDVIRETLAAVTP